MSTRSTIGYYDPEEKQYYLTHCQNDGNDVGDILKENYTKLSKVKFLVSTGAIETLDAYQNPRDPEQHKTKRESGITKFFVRDHNPEEVQYFVERAPYVLLNENGKARAVVNPETKKPYGKSLSLDLGIINLFNGDKGWITTNFAGLENIIKDNIEMNKEKNQSRELKEDLVNSTIIALNDIIENKAKTINSFKADLYSFNEATKNMPNSIKCKVIDKVASNHLNSDHSLGELYRDISALVDKDFNKYLLKYAQSEMNINSVFQEVLSGYPSPNIYKYVAQLNSEVSMGTKDFAENTINKLYFLVEDIQKNTGIPPREILNKLEVAGVRTDVLDKVMEKSVVNPSKSLASTQLKDKELDIE